MPDLAWFNGEWLPLEEACVPVRDRGYLFGDGVYEVIRSYGGRLWAVAPHLARLERSMAAIGLAGVSIEQVRALVEEANRRSGYENARVYIHVTRGTAPRVHVYDPGLRPNLLVTVESQSEMSPARYETGAAAITLPEIRWGRRDIKSLNLLPNVLARQRAHEAGADEAILVEPDGIVTEGPADSLFVVHRGVLITREEGPHILSSITRAYVLDCARRLGLAVYEGPYTIDTVREAAEIFLGGTAIGLWAITRLDGQPAGGSAPGPVTRRLSEAYLARVAAGDDRLGD
jgi:D-alanine transaminase